MAAAGTPGPRYTGWWRNPDPNSSGGGQGTTLSLFVLGTLIKTVTATGESGSGTLASSVGGVFTAGTGLVVTAGDAKVTAGNVRLGVISAFATTEPTSAVVMKTGTAPVGAITTSGGIYSSSTVVRKVIADGTNSNVET
jgi:hypothetical protein